MKTEMEGPSRFCFRKILKPKDGCSKTNDLDCTLRMLQLCCYKTTTFEDGELASVSMLLVEGSLNRNFRQYGELKSRCIAQQ